MGLRYNPFSGSFDFTRSPGSYLDGEVQTFADLPLSAAAAPLNSAWLVRQASGLWLVNRKPAGIYIRTATGGTDRNADYTYASAFPDVFSDANFTLYDDADSTKNAQFQLSGITTGTTRTLTVPDASGTIALTSDISGGGTKTYAFFTALDNQPTATNYATIDTRNSVACLDFDDATDESAVFVGITPEAASLGSGLKIRLHWAATSATSGDVRWDVSLERMTTDIDSDSFDTVASATTTTSGTSGVISVTEITLTNIDSVTAGDGFRLKITRDANNAADTLSGDVELVVCEVRSAA
jgi:hypothetical protein